MDAVARFRAIVARPPDEVELDQAALAIAQAADPEMQPAVWLVELDRLADGVTDLRSLLVRLFTEHGFTGEVEGYYDVQNSLLHRVIERARGIPITLSVLTIEVARRAGIRLHGVGMPGHFLVGIPGEARYIDAFDAGRVIGIAEAEALFRRSTGAGAEVPFGPELLPVVGPHAILTRMLNNLRAIYGRARAHNALEWVLRMQLELPDATDGDVIELARVLAQQGRFVEGAEEMETLADTRPDRAAAFLSGAMLIRSHLN